MVQNTMESGSLAFVSAAAAAAAAAATAATMR